MIDLSVIIPTYQKANHLRRNLASLQAQTYSHARFEALVIDDGSTDDTYRIVQEARQQYDYTLRYIFLNRPGVTSSALTWNVGITHAATDRIVQAGADIIMPNDTLDRFTDYFADSGPDLYVFGQCYRVHSRMANAALDLLHPWQYGIAQFREALESYMIELYHHACYWRVPMLAGASRELFAQVGGYDESYPEPWPDDDDLWVRVEAMGVLAVNAPDICGAHQYHPQRDASCGPECPCPLAQKSRTHPGPGLKFCGTPADVRRNPDGWGQLPPGSYEA